MYVIKRDGSKVEFDRQKVINAINAAFLEVDGILYETDTAEDIATEIGALVAKNENDAIKAAEEIAGKLGYADVAEEVEMIDYIFEYDIVYYDINQNECVLPAYRKFN